MTAFDDLASDILKRARARAGISILYASPASQVVPTTPEALDRLEADIDAPLPAEIRAFYSGCVQLSLVWEEGAGKKETSEAPAGWNEVCNTDGPFWKRAIAPSRDWSKRGGLVCIPKATEVFQKGIWADRFGLESYGDELAIGDEVYEDKLVYDNLYPFDFIRTYYVAALFRDPKKGAWSVLLGDGHGASWTNYKPVAVADFLGQLREGLGGLHTFRTYEDKEIWGLPKED